MRRSSADAVTKKQAAKKTKKRTRSVRVKKNSSEGARQVRSSLGSSGSLPPATVSNKSPVHHDEAVRRMLIETSPKKQRVLLKRCISKLREVSAACRPRTAVGTFLLLLLGALLGIGVFLGYMRYTKNTALIDLFVHNRVVKIGGVPLRIGEEIDPSFSRPAPPADFRSLDLSGFWEVWQHIERDFIPKPKESDSEESVSRPGSSVTREEMLYGAIKGLTLATEDPYTNFFVPEDALDFENEVIEGEIEGIGAYLTINDDDLLEVARPIPEGPADISGLRAEDIIVAIEGVSSSKYNLSEAARVIRGPAGTTVLLEIYRPVSKETLEVSIVRGAVKIPTVETEVRDGVFIITLSTFTKQTPQAFREALEEFVAGANVGGPDRLLLDMRGNMGGILSVSVYIAGLFLPENSVVLYEYSGSEHLKVYRTDKPAFRGGVLPTMTVLVDGATASASEILAAALRYYGVADVIGRGTLGKGSVQAIQPIGTDDALLKLTIAHWLTPEKKSIGDDGLAVDVDYSDEIEDLLKEDSETDISDVVLRKAILHLKSK